MSARESFDSAAKAHMTSASGTWGLASCRPAPAMSVAACAPAWRWGCRAACMCAATAGQPGSPLSGPRVSALGLRPIDRRKPSSACAAGKPSSAARRVRWWARLWSRRTPRPAAAQVRPAAQAAGGGESSWDAPAAYISPRANRSAGCALASSCRPGCCHQDTVRLDQAVLELPAGTSVTPAAVESSCAASRAVRSVGCQYLRQATRSIACCPVLAQLACKCRNVP